MRQKKEKPEILIVDDDSNVRKLYVEFLKRENYEIEEANSGEEAVAKIEKNTYDLIISDLHMKKLGGLDVLEAAKGKDEFVQVLILTGYGTVGTAVKAIKRGAFDYLAKPINSEALLYKVKNALERRKMALRLKEQEEHLERFHKMIERDLDLAKQVQASLVPANYADERIAVAVEYLPMIGLGGDFALLYDDKEGHIYLTIADVTGHGITAALMVNRIYSELRKHIRDGLQPREVTSRLNDFYYNTFSKLGIYITLFILKIDLKNKKLYYAGSAHPAGLLFRPTARKAIRLDSQNKIIGFEPSVPGRISEDVITLQSGDRIVLYTDGIIESENASGKQYGFSGLQKILTSNLTQPPETAAATVVSDVTRFANAELRDDIMLVIADVK